MVRAFEKVLELPYGENPHQRAAYYSQVGTRTHVLSMVSQLGGKELSFNNLLDLDAGRLTISEFQIPACAIIKHNNPCGVAVGKTALEAYHRAFECDPMSAYGGVVCLNRRVDRELAEAVVGQFVEVLFARGYDEDALEVLETKPNMRILDDRERRNPDMIDPALRQVVGGMLVQDRDYDLEDRSEMQVVSKRVPTEAEWGELSFAWKVCKHVRSNAVVLCRDLATVGNRRRSDEPRRLGPAGDREGAVVAGRARCWPPTPSSRSPTDPSSPSTPAPSRSSSPAARSATTRWSTRSTPPAPRWSSPPAATSATEAWRFRRPGAGLWRSTLVYVRCSAKVRVRARSWHPRRRSSVGRAADF